MASKKSASPDRVKEPVRRDTAKKPAQKKPAKRALEVPAKRATKTSPKRAAAGSKKAVSSKKGAKAAVSLSVAKRGTAGKPTHSAAPKRSVGKTKVGSSAAAAPPAKAKRVAEVKVHESVRPSPSAVRRAKEKDKSLAKSPFSHTDHASIFKGVEARKAAARAKQARMTKVQSKPKKNGVRRLTDKQLVEFEQMLLRIRAELLRQIAYLRGVSLTRSDEVNPEEDGTDAFERQLALKLAAGEGDSIFEIDEAMERIRNKIFGTCEECDCIIPVPRLKALPFARRCVECQSRIEQGPSLSEHRYF